MRIYLDHNATVPLSLEVREALSRTWGICGNASAVHADGRAVRCLIEEARSDVAALIGADPLEIIFVSGGTEANTMALRPSVSLEGGKRGCSRFLFSAVEHVSVGNGHGFDSSATEVIEVDSQGVVDREHLCRQIQKGGREDRILLSLMFANNETGVLQPVSDCASLIREREGVVHCDAVQAVGKVPVNVRELGVDLMSISAHKIGGPQGVGALFVRSGVRISPLIKGGNQERLLRAGTENFSGIVGFGAAARCALHTVQQRDRVSVLRERLESGIAAITPDAVFFSQNTPRLPNTSCFALEGVRAETLVLAFDLEGVSLSSGAACSSGKVEKSHVLRNMGFSPTLVEGAVRVSLGWDTQDSDVEGFLHVFRKIANRMGFGV